MHQFCALLVAAVLAAGLPAAPARADWSASAAASARYSDNVGNAEDPDNKRSDEIIGARLALFNVLPLGTAYLLSAGGDLNGQWFDHLSGLRNGTAEASIALRRRWGLGAFAPWMRVSLSVGRSEYDVNLRSNSGVRIALAAGQRFNDRINGSLEYLYEHHTASALGDAVPGYSADVFSGNSQTLNATLEYTLRDRLFLSTGLSVRRGDVVSTSEPEYSAYAASRALVEDPVFGEEWYAYRLVGNSYGLRAGVAYQLTEHSLLSLNVQHLRTYAGGYFYRVTMPEMSWDYHF